VGQCSDSRAHHAGVEQRLGADHLLHGVAGRPARCRRSRWVPSSAAVPRLGAEARVGAVASLPRRELALSASNTAPGPARPRRQPRPGTAAPHGRGHPAAAAGSSNSSSSAPWPAPPPALEPSPGSGSGCLAPAGRPRPPPGAPRGPVDEQELVLTPRCAVSSSRRACVAPAPRFALRRPLVECRAAVRPNPVSHSNRSRSTRSARRPAEAPGTGPRWTRPLVSPGASPVIPRPAAGGRQDDHRAPSPRDRHDRAGRPLGVHRHQRQRGTQRKPGELGLTAAGKQRLPVQPVRIRPGTTVVTVTGPGPSPAGGPRKPARRDLSPRRTSSSARQSIMECIPPQAGITAVTCASGRGMIRPFGNAELPDA
jgi:hypothetical protein